MTDIPKLVKSGKDLKDFNYNHLKPSAFNLMKMPFLKQETELKSLFQHTASLNISCGFSSLTKDRLKTILNGVSRASDGLEVCV